MNLCCNERNKDERLRQARKREGDFFIEQIVVFVLIKLPTLGRVFAKYLTPTTLNGLNEAF